MADADRSSQPPLRRRSLFVLAVVVAVVSGLGFALQVWSPDIVTDTGQASTTAVTTARTPRTSYRPVGEVSLGPGRPIGVSADGTAIIIAGDDPASTQRGCWGVPTERLFAVPLDGGARRRIGPGDEPVSMGDELRLLRSPDGSRVATVSSCEGTGLTVFVGSEGPGGAWTDVTRVDRSLIRSFSGRLDWSRDGRSLLG